MQIFKKVEKYSTKLTFQYKIQVRNTSAFNFYCYLIEHNFKKEMSAFSFGRSCPVVFCENLGATYTQERRLWIWIYRWISMKNLWIWIWMWMRNFLFTASLLIMVLV